MKKHYKVFKDGNHQKMTEKELRELGFVLFNGMNGFPIGQLEFMLELLVFMYGGSEPYVSLYDLHNNFEKNMPDGAKKEIEELTKKALKQMIKDIRNDIAR